MQQRRPPNTGQRVRRDVHEPQFLQAPGLEDFTDAQLIQLQKKFRCKRDLYIYLDHRSKCAVSLSLPAPSLQPGSAPTLRLFLCPHVAVRL